MPATHHSSASPAENTTVVGRIPVLDVRPVVQRGRRPAKAVTGESFEVSATVFREGHDAVAANVVLRDPRGRPGPWTPMRELAPGTDRWGATVTAGGTGLWSYTVEAWSDPVTTWRHAARIKIPAGMDTDLVLEEGARLYERAAAEVPGSEDRRELLAAVDALRDESRPAASRLAAALTPEVDAVLARHPLRELVTSSEPLPLLVERERALYGAWYEFFPRSEGTPAQPHGTFRTAARRLPAIAAMGFDVVYLPPIHPIGTTHRKGRNNTLTATPDDVGVPWAIGSPEGGHDTVHPALGTIDDFDQRVRKEIDAQYPDTVVLAEANQWPEDVVDYFGDYAAGGDECHMAFHFPVMPRIFMAVRRESRYPVSEILAKTPAIPSGCQWGIFLRNHDELTLEMVTDEERDYMYAEYAKDPRMRANIGIRRRLAPLLDNDRNQIELFTALLLSLPGSPILYYGDEIGMGDNIWLGDRDAVRTPMQWTPDRNAGFSSSDPGRLFLPTIMDPVYGFQVTNVEASMASPSSLLHWTRRMIEIRKQNVAFGLGTYTELPSSNPAVLAFLREYGDDLVLCVHNFSRFAQPTELDLSAFGGRHPVELFGGVRFPAVGDLPYLLTLGGHGFYWFRLRKDAA
ncbi:Alpha-1,4-glucan:maltose-1-phosphate maltosyltransferase [Streptomyces tendae]